ncbi:MAG: hypothetical protein WBZ36_22670 [Candidatus Nitrosopolaris sp.]
MALLHEIVGTIVASAALALAIYVFIRTLDYQSYKDANSDYRDVLKIAIEVPMFLSGRHQNKLDAAVKTDW